MVPDMTDLWVLLILAVILPVVNLQFPMPMYPMFPQAVPMYPMPPPPPIAVPLQVYTIKLKSPDEQTTTTTTTTTAAPEEDNVAVAVPMPMPFPVQIAVPAQQPPGFCNSRPRPGNCPPCPPCQCQPSCTPAFFSYCSSCHLKCRCRSREETPVPQAPNAPQPFSGPSYAMPYPAAPSVMVVPIPPQLYHHKKNRYGDETDSSSGYSYSSSESDMDRHYHRKGYDKFKSKHKHGFKRSLDVRDNELVKPVLTYISEDGDVKFKRRITTDEADELLGDDVFHNEQSYQTVNVVAGEDGDKNSQVVVTSNRRPGSRRHRQMVLRQGSAQHTLGDGKKELIFRPPNDKKISNLSVTFQIV